MAAIEPQVERGIVAEIAQAQPRQAHMGAMGIRARSSIARADPCCHPSASTGKRALPVEFMPLISKPGILRSRV